MPSAHEEEDDEDVVVLQDHANNADDPSDPKGHMGGARLCNLTIQIVLPTSLHHQYVVHLGILI